MPKLSEKVDKTTEERIVQENGVNLKVAAKHDDPTPPDSDLGTSPEESSDETDEELVKENKSVKFDETLEYFKFFDKDMAPNPQLQALQDAKNRVPYAVEKDPLAKKVGVQAWKIDQESKGLKITLDEVLEGYGDSGETYKAFAHHRIGELVLEKLGAKTCPPFYPLDQVIKCVGNQLLMEYMVSEGILDGFTDVDEISEKLQVLATTEARAAYAKGFLSPSKLVSFDNQSIAAITNPEATQAIAIDPGLLDKFLALAAKGDVAFLECATSSDSVDLYAAGIMPHQFMLTDKVSDELAGNTTYDLDSLDDTGCPMHW